MPQFPSRRPTLHRNCEVAMLDVVAHHQFAKRTNTNSQNYSLEKQFFPPFISEIADALSTASAGPAILRDDRHPTRASVANVKIAKLAARLAGEKPTHLDYSFHVYLGLTL